MATIGNPSLDSEDPFGTKRRSTQVAKHLADALGSLVAAEQWASPGDASAIPAVAEQVKGLL